MEQGLFQTPLAALQLHSSPFPSPMTLSAKFPAHGKCQCNRVFLKILFFQINVKIFCGMEPI